VVVGTLTEDGTNGDEILVMDGTQLN
jgi:hypothetical protein